jgi:ribose transport system substrate-binding protein
VQNILIKKIKENKMKKSLFWLLVLVISVSMVAAFSLSSCKTTETTATTAAETTVAATTVAETTAAETTAALLENKDITVVLIPKVAVPFFDDCNNGGKEAAAKLGVNYQWVAPENTQGATQVRVIEDLIAKHVNGIAISPNDPKSVEAVLKEAAAAGIKVITFDSDAPDSGRLMYIGTINKAAGKTMGDAMAKAIGGKGKVSIITGGLGALNLQERIEGVKEALIAYPDIKVVDLQGTDDDMAKAVSVAESMLRATPDLTGVFCMSQVGGPAIYKVLSTKEFANRKGKITVFAFDDLPDALKGVQEGYIQGIMVQRPITMGKLAVEHLVKLIKGEETNPENIDTGCVIVNIDNITSYTK